MLNDFSSEYATRSDNELLHLASARPSLTTEAASALDAELRRRKLTEADRLDHQRFFNRQERREYQKRRRKTFGPFKDRLSWLGLLWMLLAMGLISFAYSALPARYRMQPDWQEAAAHVMIASLGIALLSKGVAGLQPSPGAVKLIQV